VRGRILRIARVMDRTGMARSTIYLRMKQGRFPKPIPLGGGGIVGWLESDIDAWIDGLVRAELVKRRAGFVNG
jgi:prophage regulatory protein